MRVRAMALGAVACALALAAAGCRCVGGQAKTRGGIPPGGPCACSDHPLAGKLDELARQAHVADDGPALDGGRLVVHLEAEPPHLMPLVRSDAWIRRITGHEVLESLVRTDPRTLEVVPELVELAVLRPPAGALGPHVARLGWSEHLEARRRK